EPVHTPEQAWNIVFAYARRWQIEMSLRFTKSEMAFESPRLLAWQAGLKFLLIASLAYAFLLSLLPNTDFLFHLLSSSATEQESGAKRSQLHSFACAWPFLAFGSSSALTPSLP